MSQNNEPKCVQRYLVNLDENHYIEDIIQGFHYPLC